jgi:hypothetical protein
MEQLRAEQRVFGSPRCGFADQSRLYQDDGSLIFAWGVHSSCHVLARRLLPGSPGRLILPGLSGAPA